MNKFIERYGLFERDIKTIINIFHKYPEVQLVHVFGSRAIGASNPGSDIDLAIMNKLSERKTFLMLKNDFEESSLPFKVDLVEFHSLTNNDLIDHIRRVGKVFYHNNKSFV